MSCTDVREDLSAFLDGELEPRRRAEVEAHLEECGACRALLQVLREGAEAVGGLPRESAPADFAGRVLASLDAAPSGGGRLLRLLTPWVGAAAAAALLFAVFQAARENRENTVYTARGPALEAGSGAEARDGAPPGPTAPRDDDKFVGLLQDKKSEISRRNEEPVAHLGAEKRPGEEQETPPPPAQAPPRLKSADPEVGEQDLEKKREIAAARARMEAASEETKEGATAAAEREKLDEVARQAEGLGARRGATGGGKGRDAAPPAAPAPSEPAPAPGSQPMPDPATLEDVLKNAPVYCLVLPNERFADLRARAVQTLEGVWDAAGSSSVRSSLEAKARKLDASSVGFSAGQTYGLDADSWLVPLTDQEFAALQKSAQALGRFRPALPEERTLVRQLLDRESSSKDGLTKGPPPPAPGAAKAPPPQPEAAKVTDGAYKGPGAPAGTPKPAPEAKPSGRVAGGDRGDRAPASDGRKRENVERAPPPVRRPYVIRILPERPPSGR